MLGFFVALIGLTGGIYPWIVLLAVFVSGIWLNLPGTFLTIVRVFSPKTIDPYALQSAAQSGLRAITIGEAASIADQNSPGGRMMWLAPASDSAGLHWISPPLVEASLAGRRDIEAHAFQLVECRRVPARDAHSRMRF